ncbi:MAG: hypothetical protein ABFD07_01295, partial [Methanobacterium sp.]
MPFDNIFDDIYIPTIDDYDAVYNGKITIEELHALHSTPSTITEDPTPIIDSIITRETPYFPSGSKDKLKNDCESNEVLVSRDANDKGAKAYMIVAWDKWLKKTSRFDTNDYECLRGNVYPYMDIESEKDDIDVDAMLNHSIGVFIDALQTAGLTVT